MPISSYQTPNSYQELDFRPYEMPYEAQLKELGAKNQYWMEGVNKIQSAYSKITGLNPQWAKNKEALKSFNESAKEQIKKIASTDLGVQGNAEQVNGVIAPLYDMTNPISEGIILDDYANKTGQALVKNIETYKTKDKGAYYSPNNAKYALEWYQDYIKKANDPNASLEDLRRVKENVKGYTPYYDASKELEVAISKCPENTNNNIQAKNGYISDVTTTTRDASGCIASFLSDKARSQFAIDGYVTYGKNYSALGSDFKASALEQNTYNQHLIGLLKADLTTKGITDEEKKAINEQITEKEKLIIDNTAHINKINNNDFSEIEKNYETYAGSIYTRNKLKSYSSFNKNSTVTSLDNDVTFLTNMKMQNDNNQDAIQRQHETNQNSFNQAQMNSRAIMGAKNPQMWTQDKYGNIVFNPEYVGANGQSAQESLRTANSKELELRDENTFKAEASEILKSKTNITDKIAVYLQNKYGTEVKPKEIEGFILGTSNDPVKREELAKDPYFNMLKKEYNEVLANQSLHNAEFMRIESQIAEEIKNSNKDVIIETASGNIKTDIKNIHKFVTYRTDARAVAQGYKVKHAYTTINGREEIIKNQAVVKEAFKVSSDIRDNFYKKAKTYNSAEITTNILNTDEENGFRNGIFNQVSGITDEKGNIVVKDVKNVRTGYTDGKSTIEVIIPTPDEDDVKSNIIAALGNSTDRTVTYQGQGIYKIKFNNPSQYPLPSAGNGMLNKKIATSIEDINSTSTIKNNQKVAIFDNYNGYQIYINKGNPLIWVVSRKDPNSKPYSVNSVSELVKLIEK